MKEAERTSRLKEAVRESQPVALSHSAALPHSDVQWDAITPRGEHAVYDLSVDGDLHNFVAADLVVHNSIEQDADVVLFLYREGLHDRELDRAKTDLIVAKNRNGPVDDLKLVFIDSQTAFREPYIEQRLTLRLSATSGSAEPVPPRLSALSPD